MGQAISAIRLKVQIRHQTGQDETLTMQVMIQYRQGQTVYCPAARRQAIDDRSRRRAGNQVGQTQAERRVVSRIAWGYQKAVELSEDTGIQVCFETTPHESLHLSDGENCREILERVSDLGLVLDTANMLPHGDTTMDAYALLKNRIAYVHLKDVCLIHKRTLNFTRERTADERLMECTVWGRAKSLFSSYMKPC
ncbi:sugar phosphate isomerase/epimerase family protein [Ruthenibacterium lactatiformans]|uniref:sugar phosphate isomerase/epimerase family protein n=1 Tax=Ruthenibacterium lactatiformans TaxID=1550024 RepID=UPI0022E70378|nr:TIM barrel protein [Ruthenibacterium lactatiformans]